MYAQIQSFCTNSGNSTFYCPLVRYDYFEIFFFSFQSDTSGMGNVPWFSLLTMVTISASLSFMAEGKPHLLFIYVCVRARINESVICLNIANYIKDYKNRFFFIYIVQ